MGIFLKRTRGSITVLVTLILVPTIFFTGFMVDLARVKLYSNQAVMAADNFGETVLTQYDDLLKELYGLFAVTQNEDGKKAIEDLKEYMKYSFEPAGGGKSVGNGFMPYQSADIELGYEAADHANLANEDVFATQVNDFMKFRIAQQMAKSGESVLDQIEEIRGLKDNAKAAQTKMELDKKADDALEMMKPFYEELKEIDGYPAYIDRINDAIKGAKKTIKDLSASASYQKYVDYVKHADEIEAALNVPEDERTEADLQYIAMYEAYRDDEAAHEENLRKVMEDAIDKIGTAVDSGSIRFQNFKSKANNLYIDANGLADKLEDVVDIRAELEQQLNEEGVTTDYKNQVKEEIQHLDELTGGGAFNGHNFVAMADAIKNNGSVNDSYESQTQSAIFKLESVMEDLLEVEDPSESYPNALDKSLWFDFHSHSVYERIYQSLKKCFDTTDDAATKKAKSKKKEAKGLSKEFTDSMKQDEETSARDIPESFHFNHTTSDRVKSFKIDKIFETIGGYFSKGSLGEAGEGLLSTFYMIQYDKGMFSDRVTNVKTDEEGNTIQEKSLVNVPMASNVNYLYQAELEYIVSGHYSSKDNLTETRNSIVLFRFMMNFLSTYTVHEINDAIRAISEAASVINPVLGMAVSGALRLAIAGLESGADWNLLKKGEKVTVYKQKLEQFNCADIGTLLDGEVQISSDHDGDGFGLDYGQYLEIMMLIMTSPEEVAARTANLVTLNVNEVKQDSPETLSNLEFKLEDAVTAVDATFSVHLDFVVMPDGFAKKMTDAGVYGELVEFEKNHYKYTVTRGY